MSDEHHEAYLPKLLFPSIQHYELGIEAAGSDPEKTLMVSLTERELLSIQYALAWVGTLYGRMAFIDLRKKLYELVEAQGFCECDNCREKRGETE